MSDVIRRADPDAALVIRTDFAHEQEWVQIQAMIVEPQTEDGFAAIVQFVDDKAYDGLTASRLLQMVPAESDYTFAFLVDTVALTHPEWPILVVNFDDWAEDGEVEGRGPHYGATFRVVPSAMWSVENNLSIANMDWEDFADSVDDDGIFRGFG